MTIHPMASYVFYHAFKPDTNNHS